MRAIWKGYLKCSLVTIPLEMVTATTKRPLQFHLYHSVCGDPGAKGLALSGPGGQRLQRD